MAPPPEALAAGWPAAIALAVALATSRTRARRRRENLEAAIHELRRPLQALSLSAPRGAHLSGALTALSDLERAVGDGPTALRLRPIPLRALVEGAVERCLEPGQVSNLSWAAGDARVLADAPRLGRALDNLLENALVHGRPPLRINASIGAGGVRLVIANGIQRRFAGEPKSSGSGHGLGIVSTTVEAHGGRFLFDRDERSATAMVELPLAPPSFPDVARESTSTRSLPHTRAA